MSVDRLISSLNCTAYASEEVFSMLMNSLPVGGTITRIACGSTTRRSVLPWVMPSACEASVWPMSTDWMPARTISDMYAASLRPRPSSAARNGVMTWFISSL